MEYSDGKYFGKKEKVEQEKITGPSVHAFIFHIKLIIGNSLWLTYERDYYHGLAVYAQTENQDNLVCHFWDITNLLFWVIWACLARPVKNNSINLWKTLMLSCMQKLNFIPNFFTEMSQKYCKLAWVLWACMAKPFKKKYQIAENFDVYHNTKSPIHRLILSWDIIKILHNCYFEYIMHAWPCSVSTCRKLSLSGQKTTSSLPSFLRYYKDFANLLFWVLWA